MRVVRVFLRGITMGDVIDFDGVTTHDIEVDKVLECARDCDSVLIFGWKGDDFYCAMSRSDFAENILLIEIGKKVLLDTMMGMLDD